MVANHFLPAEVAQRLKLESLFGGSSIEPVEGTAAVEMQFEDERSAPTWTPRSESSSSEGDIQVIDRRPLYPDHGSEHGAGKCLEGL